MGSDGVFLLVRVGIEVQVRGSQTVPGEYVDRYRLIVRHKKKLKSCAQHCFITLLLFRVRCNYRRNSVVEPMKESEFNFLLLARRQAIL